MSETIASDSMTAILGMGLTGRSCARYLSSRGQKFAMFDADLAPSTVDELHGLYPESPLFQGKFEYLQLRHYRRLLVSPGISLETQAISQALSAGAELSSDFDLLRAETDAPIVGITGSNGKTTVTSLLGSMARAAGIRAAVGGNIGTPVLDFLLSGEDYDLFLLELSSFQLERSAPLMARVATVLNVSPDHMDRYADLFAYQRAKQAIYRGCRTVVFNRDDKLTSPLLGRDQQSLSFGLGRPDLKDFGIIEEGGRHYLARGNSKLLACDEMKLHGSHNRLNALAALALGTSMTFSMDAMLAALRQFPGLSHRCQWVAESQGVQFFNDSKATNVGATLAALRGLSRRDQDIVLIAGGVGKAADFTPLEGGLQFLKGLVLIGEAADEIGAVFGGRVAVVRAGDMGDALSAARGMAESGDMVLLSPACSSFDMYANYAARGDDFIQRVVAATEVDT